MAFQFNPNQFVAAVQAVLKSYEGKSNTWVIATQATDEDNNIFGILDANGFEDYRRNWLREPWSREQK